MEKIHKYEDMLKTFLEIFENILKNLKESLNKRFIDWKKVDDFKYQIEDTEKLIEFIKNFF